VPSAGDDSYVEVSTRASPGIRCLSSARLGDYHDPVLTSPPLGGALRSLCPRALWLFAAACVPEGPPTEVLDDALGEVDREMASPRTVDRHPIDPPLEGSFRDDFERDEPGLAWRALSPAWRIDEGWLCAANARNRGIWLRRRLPENARIRFDARAGSADGDLKVEVWGDGQTGASKASYDDASGYVLVLGGWQNRLHVLARENEHGRDRLVAQVRENGEVARDRAVEPGRIYRFEIERGDGETLVWRVDGEIVHQLADPAPLAGRGHDHFGFNDWVAPVCFDNLEIEGL
jgi:hypothetical protein